MKKILGIVASPRILGNSEILVKEIARNIPEEHELKLLRLQDYSLFSCTGCYRCLIGNTGCHLKDDLKTIIDAIVEADALIVATPTYFVSANASLKLLIDRGLAFYAHIDKLWGKPAVGVGVAGIQGKDGSTLLGLEVFLKALLTENKGCKMFYGALPGEVFLDEKNKEECKLLGEALFQPAKKITENACPLCGSRSFRFGEGTKIQCMICSNSGEYKIVGGKMVLDIKRGPIEFMLTKEDVIEHKEWLLGMREKFIQNKQKLRKIVVSYMDDGKWIRKE